jgi:hypothetical protein
MVAPFTGLKSSAAFPVTRKTNKDITSIASNRSYLKGQLLMPFSFPTTTTTSLPFHKDHNHFNLNRNLRFCSNLK